VVAVELPSLIDPFGELFAMHAGSELTPSAASIAALSTGQRSNGAQIPLSVCADAEPAVTKRADATSAPRMPIRTFLGIELTIDLLPSPK
jgi:hypothetical protein